MCALKNNLIESGSIRQARARRIVPDNAGLAGRYPAASGSRFTAGSCRILPDTAAATAAATVAAAGTTGTGTTTGTPTTTPMMTMIISTSSSSGSSNQGKPNV